MDLTRTMNRNRPTVAAAFLGFVGALVAWGTDVAAAAGIPDPVVTSGAAFVILAAAYVVGKIAQGQLADGIFAGDRAPWADDTHRAAVAYALTRDPSHHPEERAAILEQLGISSTREVHDLLGILPGSDDPEGPTA